MHVNLALHINSVQTAFHRLLIVEHGSQYIHDLDTEQFMCSFDDLLKVQSYDQPSYRA